MPCVRNLKILIFTCLVASACSFGEKKPSILVIAIDSLPYDSILCSEGEYYKGFRLVCDEMTRFTHTFTPATLAQPAVASLLTGLYPLDHGVHHNGDDSLNATLETVSEIAIRNKYKTSFFSGGPPIWRKSGLQQGFELFDDSINIAEERYYRPVLENFKLFIKWLQDESDDTPFLSYIYLPDLQFIEVATTDNNGLSRELTRKGQLQEIDESLEFLIQQLKKNKRWNNTWVFIVGVNGQTTEGRSGELAGTNLFFENTRVTFFAKKTEKEKDRVNPRVIDATTSLVDVGKTIYEILNEMAPVPKYTQFPIYSLKDKIENTSNLRTDPRVLVMESGWGYWKDLSPIRYAFLYEDYLMVYDNPAKIFNTVVDRNQVYPMSLKAVGNNNFIKQILEAIALLSVTPWEVYDSNRFKEYMVPLGVGDDLISASDLYRIREREAQMNNTSEADENKNYLAIDYNIQKINFLRGSVWDVKQDLIRISGN